MPVVFNDKEHRYTNSRTGENYISVTTLLGQYKPKFDLDGQAANVARREGLLVEEVKAYWADLNRISTTRGTAIHKIMETYIESRVSTGEEQELISYIEDQLNKNKEYTIHSEQVLYNDHFRVAGMADIILEGKDTFKVWDLKTNKKFRFTNTFTTDKFLLSPVDHLVNCEYSNYALQLSLYAYMKEELSNKKCEELKIIYLKKNPDNTSIVEEFYMPYLKSDIQKILSNKYQKELFYNIKTMNEKENNQ
jgi:hypothetical protein